MGRGRLRSLKPLRAATFLANECAPCSFRTPFSKMISAITPRLELHFGTVCSACQALLTKPMSRNYHGEHLTVERNDKIVAIGPASARRRKHGKLRFGIGY